MATIVGTLKPCCCVKEQATFSKCYLSHNVFHVWRTNTAALLHCKFPRSDLQKDK